MMLTRRSFLKTASATMLAASAPLGSLIAEGDTSDSQPWLTISLQQYSFQPWLVKGKLDLLDYPQLAVEKCGISRLEYFNGPFMDRAGDARFFATLKKRCDDVGATNELILCKNARALDDADSAIRKRAATDYLPWLEAAKTLGCHSIRVDCRSKGEADEVLKQATDGLNRLCDLAEPLGIAIIVENHGGHSSRGDWVAKLMRSVDRKNCGTLPDFGNFRNYDRYQGVKDMLPWAKAICAKTYRFDEDGNDPDTDFLRMLTLIKASGFTGSIGVEYEGKQQDPIEGVVLTRKLIERTLQQLG